MNKEEFNISFNDLSNSINGFISGKSGITITMIDELIRKVEPELYKQPEYFKRFEDIIYKLKSFLRLGYVPFYFEYGDDGWSYKK